MGRARLGKWWLPALLAVLAAVAVAPRASAQDKPENCVTCHEKLNPGEVAQWRASEHFKQGVTCSTCHGREKADVDAFAHNGAYIATIVTPKNCGQCHQKEFDEQKGSHHAKAGQILGSLDNYLGDVIGGPPASDIGCRQCHGSVVKLDANKHPTKDTWPNTGMGRINPDGSAGSCSACHGRHEFSVRQARQPESCGKCHLGPDHPQTEVWQESKHGMMYRANRELMKLDSKQWRAGKEYFSGPTCASCHMSAAGNQPVTHDVGDRLSWTLRPVISSKLNLVAFDDNSKDDVIGDAPVLPKVGDMFKFGASPERKVADVVTWQQRRGKMENVCVQCHQTSFISGAYAQFDSTVGLYNDKFAKPAKAIMDDLKAQGKLSKADFDEKLEWTYYELWHHQGRRARHGAAMQGPDYAWWHGIYDVAKTFYTEFLPEVKEVAGDELSKSLLDKYVYTNPGHIWLRDGMSKEALQKIQEFYNQRYGEGGK
ncbi:MAG: cytochrome c3 family protein [Armatimonadetes bacterium]|nr:cytochrome c3 family protein [Armatimonadota bacterium]